MSPSSTDDIEKLSDEKSKRYVRPINELWEMWGPRVKMRIYPFTYAVYEEVERLIYSHVLRQRQVGSRVELNSQTI